VGQKWYQSIAYDFPLSRWTFFSNLKGAGPLNLKKVFSVLISFNVSCLINVASAAKLCCSGVLYISYTFDSAMLRYSITGIAYVALQWKFIPACGIRINPAQGYTGFSAECYISYVSDIVAPNAAITGLAESCKEESNLPA
jgi:hypothetical protein